MSWLLPNHYQPWLNFPSETSAFAATAVLLAAVLARNGDERLTCPRTVWWVAGTACLPWLYWLAGVSLFAGDALMVSMYIVAWAMAICIGFKLAQTSAEKFPLALAHMLWVAALLSAMIGVVQWLRLADAVGLYVAQSDFDDPAMGNMAQPNQLATLLLIGLVAYCFVFERQIIGKFVFAVGIFFMTWVLVLTHSRAGMVGVVCISAFLLAKRRNIGSRLKVWMVLTWLVFFVFANLASVPIDQALYLNTERETLITTNGRLPMYLQALAGLKHSPWVGYGWNQTATAMMAGAIESPGALITIYAHDVLIDILAWNGVPMGLLLIAIGTYWVFTRMYRVKEIGACYAFAALIPFIIGCLVEFSFAYAYFLLSAGLLMGVVEAEPPVSHSRGISRRWVSASLIAWTVLGCGIVYEYLLVEEDMRVTRFENMNVGSTDAAYHPPDIRLLTQLAAMQRAYRLRPTPNMPTQQLDDLRRVSMRYPQGPLALRYAMALGLNNDTIGARHMMAVVQAMQGPRFYSHAADEWSEMAASYPVLKSIKLP